MKFIYDFISQQSVSVRFFDFVFKKSKSKSESKNGVQKS